MSEKVVLVLRMYQKYVSPMLGMNCRFVPSCSEYAVQAVQKYGVRRGLYLALRRILRCNPFGKFGYDPI